MTIKEKILEAYTGNSEFTVKELVDKLNTTKQSVHLALNKLMEEGLVLKSGKAPKTVYRIQETTQTVKEDASAYFSDSETDFFEKQFLYISPIGEYLKGIDGFQIWCEKRDLPIKKTAKEFIKTRKKYLQYFDKNGLIDGKQKLQSTKGIDAVYLDKVHYLDFYAIERFGKTYLGTLLHYAKQGQNKMLMQKLMDEIKDKIRKIVEKEKIDAVCFVPPTIRREVQIMKFIQNKLNLSIPVIEIRKTSGIIPVPQKSLSKIEDRLANAKGTFAVTDTRNFGKVLIIDDAMGSGATMNEIARKIKSKKVAQKVFGLAVVGSFKGFDVITDV